MVGGPAFTFAYPDNLRRLREAGAELLAIDPLVDPALPRGVKGLYACGGFPEVFVEALAANEPLLGDVRTKVLGGLSTWAECGGLLWLAESLGSRRLCGAIAVHATMTGRITVGYREATVLVDNPVAAAGSVLARPRAALLNRRATRYGAPTGRADRNLDGWLGELHAAGLLPPSAPRV